MVTQTCVDGRRPGARRRWRSPAREIVWHAYVLAALGGTALVFDAPGRHALTFQMVGREELPNAIALNASLFNASRVIGPAFAGVLDRRVRRRRLLRDQRGQLPRSAAEPLAHARSASSCSSIGASDHPTMLPKRAGRPLATRGTRPRSALVLMMTMVVSTVGFNFHVLVPVLAVGDARRRPDGRSACSRRASAQAPSLGALLTAALGRASWKALLRRRRRVQRLAARPRSTDDRRACAALLFVIGDLLHPVDVEQPVDPPAVGARPPARPRPQPLPASRSRALAPLGGLLTGWLAEVGGTQLAFLVAGGTGLVMTLVALREVYGRHQRAVLTQA